MHVWRPDKSPTRTTMDNMLHFQSLAPNQTKFAFQSFASDEHDWLYCSSFKYFWTKLYFSAGHCLLRANITTNEELTIILLQNDLLQTQTHATTQVQWTYNKFGKECVLWKQNPHPLAIPENCGYYLLISHKPPHNKNPKNYKICVVWFLFFTEYALT